MSKTDGVYVETDSLDIGVVGGILVEPTRFSEVLLSNVCGSDECISIQKEEWEALKETVEAAFAYYTEGGPVITLLHWHHSTEVYAKVLIHGVEVVVQGIKIPLGVPVPERDMVVIERAVELYKQIQGNTYE